MIINGQYVEYDEKKAAIIQTDLNKLSNVQTSVKSDIEKPKDVLEGGASVDFGFSIFDQDENNSTLLERYGYYREMGQMEFINRGLEIIADNATLENTEGDVAKIFSNNESIKDRIYDLFYKRLDMNMELWSIVYETSKIGNNYYEVIPDSYDKPTKIIYLRYLKPEKVERIEQNGKLLFYSYKTEENRNEEKTYNPKLPPGHKEEAMETIYKLQPWQIIHFKVKDDKDELPYGSSLLKAGIRTYRRLSLLEDVMLVYRVSRAPERRVFYIDVGQMNYTDSKKFIQKIKSQYRTQNFLDENGNINRKSHVLSTTSDIFVPRREGGQGTKIDTLQGGEALKSIDDLDYFKDKILRLLNIPMAYLGGEADRSRGSLAQLDYSFGRFIERIQNHIKKGLNKIIAIDLYFGGYKKADLSDFSIDLTAPSNIKEITDIDIMNQRMSLIITIQQTELFSREWILKNIIKLNNKEISDIKLQKQMEAQTMPQTGEGGEMGGLGMGMGGTEPGMEMGGTEPGAEEAPEAEETPGTEETPEAGMEIASVDVSKEQQITEALVKVLGKDFLIKESEDFFRLINFIKSSKKEPKPSHSPLLERASEIFQTPLREEKVDFTTPSLRKQIMLGEMRGLMYEGGKRYFKLYENNGGKFKEKETYLD
jgi:hypothetical protein